MYHVVLALSFFSYLVEWSGLSGSSDVTAIFSNVSTTTIGGRS
jgi:hypothetical protein